MFMDIFLLSERDLFHDDLSSSEISILYQYYKTLYDAIISEKDADKKINAVINNINKFLPSVKGWDYLDEKKKRNACNIRDAIQCIRKILCKSWGNRNFTYKQNKYLEIIKLHNILIDLGEPRLFPGIFIYHQYQSIQECFPDIVRENDASIINEKTINVFHWEPKQFLRYNPMTDEGDENDQDNIIDRLKCITTQMKRNRFEKNKSSIHSKLEELLGIEIKDSKGDKEFLQVCEIVEFIKIDLLSTETEIIRRTFENVFDEEDNDKRSSRKNDIFYMLKEAPIDLFYTNDFPFNSSKIDTRDKYIIPMSVFLYYIYTFCLRIAKKYYEYYLLYVIECFGCLRAYTFYVAGISDSDDYKKQFYQEYRDLISKMKLDSSYHRIETDEQYSRIKSLLPPRFPMDENLYSMILFQLLKFDIKLSLYELTYPKSFLDFEMNENDASFFDNDFESKRKCGNNLEICNSSCLINYVQVLGEGQKESYWKLFNLSEERTYTYSEIEDIFYNNKQEFKRILGVFDDTTIERIFKKTIELSIGMLRLNYGRKRTKYNNSTLNYFICLMQSVYLFSTKVSITYPKMEKYFTGKTTNKQSMSTIIKKRRFHQNAYDNMFFECVVFFQMICNLYGTTIAISLFQCLSELGDYWQTSIACSMDWRCLVEHVIACIETTERVFQVFIKRDKTLCHNEQEWANGLPYPERLIKMMCAGLSLR